MKNLPRGWRWALWLPVLLWYGVIWNFSAQTAELSGDLSDRLLWKLLHLISPAFAGAESGTQQAAVEILSFFERKAAHMFLYFILALLLWLALSALMEKRRVRGGAALVLCALMAGGDEYHQTFVPGRSGELRDVLVDLSGAVIALALLALILWTLEVRRRGGLPGRQAWIPLGLCVLALVLVPALAGAEGAAPLLEGLSQRFLPAWQTLPETDRVRVTEELRPIVAQTLRALLFGAAFCGGALSAALARRQQTGEK